MSTRPYCPRSGSIAADSGSDQREHQRRGSGGPNGSRPVQISHRHVCGTLMAAATTQLVLRSGATDLRITQLRPVMAADPAEQPAARPIRRPHPPIRRGQPIFASEDLDVVTGAHRAFLTQERAISAIPDDAPALPVWKVLSGGPIDGMSRPHVTTNEPPELDDRAERRCQHRDMSRPRAGRCDS
jgi:hypothetical protein